MATTLAERLRAAMEHAQLKQTHIEARAGFTTSYLSKPLAGQRRSISYENTKKIAEICGVSATWLAFGEGPMVPAADGHTLPRRTKSNTRLRAALAKAFDGKVHTLDDLENVVTALAHAEVQSEVHDSVLAEAARAWLDAARELRVTGHEVNAETLLLRTTLEVLGGEDHRDPLAVAVGG